ncbi:MAG TPA: cation:proton antiporter [Terracidiphilus sp.]|nr:cation:proton antiporter [Terracidiphilus sp.]
MLTTLTGGWLARKLGQSRVVGEIVGGILLGPSVFGRLVPNVANSLFPKPSFATFEILSMAGLILFMLLVGMELDYEMLYRQRKTALLASGMGVLVPFAMGAVLARPLRVRFVAPGIGGSSFVLFLGIAMSITAFPVLARILEERGLQRTELGTTAIFCAAVGDLFGWLLLSLALALMGAPNASSSMPMRLAGLAAYLIVMLGVFRALAAQLARRLQSSELSFEMLSIVVALTLASAAATELIGVHPLFGAFIAGVCFPRLEKWQKTIRDRLDMLVSVLLLPLFFALTGMRTQLGLLNGKSTLLWSGIVLLAAAFGKIAGAAAAARWTGWSWRDATALGALLNTRGLVELVVLNIAYKVGVFSPTLFSMMVVMALLTTMSTTPILNLLGIQNHSLIKPLPEDHSEM